MKMLILLSSCFAFLSCTKQEPCPEIYRPVCSPDGTKFENACKAENAGVKEFSLCV